MLWLCICKANVLILRNQTQTGEGRTHGYLSTSIASTLFLVFLLPESSTAGDNQVLARTRAVIIHVRLLMDETNQT